MDYNPESHNAVFARLEQKLDSIVASTNDIKKEQEKLESKFDAKWDDIHKRVILLEHYKYYFSGVVAVISFGATYLINKFWRKE